MVRYLGQHFLKNKTKLRKIVEALELKDAVFGEPRPFGRGDTIIEIGPGHGELTESIKYKVLGIKISPLKKIEIWQNY